MAASAVYFAADLKALRLIELKMLDYRFQLRGEIPISPEIVLVSIDEKDTELLGRWPWPRKYHADLIQILDSLGARVIGYDILFTEPDREDPESDGCLVDAAKAHGSVCFPMAFSRSAQHGDLLPIPSLSKAACTIGFVNVTPDEDGIVRQVQLSSGNRPTLGMALLLRYLGIGSDTLRREGSESVILPLADGARLRLPVDAQDRLLVNYPGTTTSWRWLHFVQIIMAYMDLQQGKTPPFDPAILQDKIVLVGSTHAGLPDVIETPLGSAYGIELHASLINSVLQRRLLRPLSPIGQALLYGLTVLTAALLTWRLRPLRGGLACGAMALILLGGAYLVFSRLGIWIRVVQPTTGLLTIYLCGSVFHYFTVERKERAVRNAFRHYVSPAVVSVLSREPDRLRLGGEIKALTMLFADIRGFTHLAEKMDPDTLGRMLNRYFSAMTDRIFACGGTLDKFIGDAIMAVFGAPIDAPNHPLDGCRAALAMIAGLKTFNRRWQAEGMAPLRIGIGLNTGQVKVGNFGSSERFDYTVIGGQVNLASRLEGLTKAYGVDIIVSEATYRGVADRMLCRPLDIVRVKGSGQPVRIYELLGPEAELPGETIRKARMCAEGLQAYRRRHWPTAQHRFADVHARFPQDRTARLFLERIDRFMAAAPPEDWDGVFTHTEK